MERREPVNQRYNVFRTMLLSAVLPCLFATIFWAMFFLPMINRTAENNDRAYEQVMLESAAAQLDNLTDMVDSAVHVLEHNTWVRPLYIDHINEREPAPTEKEDIIGELSVTVGRHPGMVQYSFRFFEYANVVYTSKGVVSDLALFRESHPDSLQYSFVPCNDNAAGFTTACVGETNYLVYRTPFRDIEGGRQKGEINLFFKADQFGEQLSQAVDGNAAAFRLTDSEGKTLWTYDTKLYYENSVEISTVDSSGRFTLCISVPESVHHRTRAETGPTVVTTLVAALLISLLLSFVLSRATYRPLQNVLWKYVGKQPRQSNEFVALAQVFDQLHPLARQKLLGGLLDGTAGLHEGLAEQLERCGISFSYLRCNVIALEMPFSQLRGEEETLTSEAELMMEGLLEDLTGALPMAAYLYYQDTDHYQILVNYQLVDHVQIYLKRLADHCRLFLEKQGVEADFYMGVGMSVDTVQEIYRASDQAETALNVAALNRMTTTAWYRDLSDQAVYDYNYPMTEEMLLSKTVTNGNAERAKELLREIIRSNQWEKQLNPDTLWLLYMDLASTVARSGRSLGINLPQIDQKRTVRSLEEIYERVEDMIDHICKQILAQRQRSIQRSEQEILDYIDEHIYDADLSLNEVADIFQKSQTYISILFKEQRGENYNTYVNRIRIMRAMQLMVEQDLDSNAVYPLVGYTNLSTFRRNFTKYAKCNPGQAGRSLPDSGT